MRYGFKDKSKQGQGHLSSAICKSHQITESALRLLLLSKLKKFEDPAIARFCSNEHSLNAKVLQIIIEISLKNNINLNRILRYIMTVNYTYQYRYR